MTERIYLNDTYLYSCTAILQKICALESPFKGGNKKIVLNRSIFHPQGGGQPSDIGRIVIDDSKWIDVCFVQLIGDVLEHYGNINGIDSDIPNNINVTMEINKDNRIANSKSHSSGHLIDVAVSKYSKRLQLTDNPCKLNWIPTKGYHFPDGAYVEYEGKLEFTPLNPDQMKSPTAIASFPTESVLIGILNDEINQLINENIETDIINCDKESIQSHCPELTPDAVSHYPDQIRLIRLGGNIIPCGGTHVRSTGELIGLVINKIKCKKNVVKVSYSI